MSCRRLGRFDIEKRKLIAEIPLKNAGFHGMFAYQWGGYSDVDLAVDEFGLWVIYRSVLVCHPSYYHLLRLELETVPFFLGR